MELVKGLRNKAYRLLRWSERYTKTDMLYLTKGGFWLLFGQGLTVLSSLALAIAFANLVEPEKYGNYKYVLSLAGIIGAFSLTGLNTAVARAVAHGYEGTLRYAFRLSLLWSFGMIAIAGIGGIYYLLHNNFFLAYSLFIIGVASPVISACSLYRPFLSGKKAFREMALFGVIQGTLPSLVVLGLLFLDAPLLVLVGAYFTASLVTVFGLYARIKKLANNDSVDPATGNLGKHLSIMGTISAIGGRLDSILIFQLLGGAELAIYSLAVTVPDIIRGSLKNVTSLALPKFAHKTKEEMKKAVWGKAAITLFGTGLVAIAYMLTAPYLFEFLFPKYLVAIPYSQVYALSIIASLLLASTYFDSQAAVKERYILNVVNNTNAIIAIVVGIYFFGLWGAIFARLITRLINIALSAILIARN